jgi:hypothetical protein
MVIVRRWPSGSCSQAPPLSPWVNLHSAITFTDASKMNTCHLRKLKFAKVEADPLQSHYDKMHEISFCINLSDKCVAENFSLEWVHRLCRWIEVSLTDCAETKAPLKELSKLLAMDVGQGDLSKQLAAVDAADAKLEGPQPDEPKAKPKAKRKSAAKKSAATKKPGDDSWDYGHLIAATNEEGFHKLWIPVHGAIGYRRSGLGNSTQIATLRIANYAIKKQGSISAGEADSTTADAPENTFAFDIPIYVGSAGCTDTYGTKVSLIQGD